jgi:hypothetical protein
MSSVSRFPAISTALLIAPSSYHRLRWRDRDKEYLPETSNRLTIAGLACLTVAVNCVVFVISDFLYGFAAAIPSRARWRSSSRRFGTRCRSGGR